MPTPGKYHSVGDGYCVSFVQAHGYAQYHGDAKTWIRYSNTDQPSIGGVVVLDESSRGHVAIILSFTDTQIRIVEQNYVGNGIVSYRTIPRDYSKILSYIMLQ